MAHSRRSSFRSPRSSRRATSWDSGPEQLAVVGSSAVGKTVWATGVALGKEEKATLVRLHGLLAGTLSRAVSAGDGMSGAVGIGLVSNDAAAVGATAIPGPFSDPSWPGWWFHQYFDLRGVAAQTIGQDVARNAGLDLHMPLDSKAMRIMGSAETLVGVFEVGTETGDAQINWSAQTRILVKMF